MSPIRTSRTKAESAKVSSHARKRKSAGKIKELSLVATKDANRVYEARPRAAKVAATRKLHEELPEVSYGTVPSRHMIPQKRKYLHLTQVTVGGKWRCRDDFAVGRSLIMNAGRGLFCMSRYPAPPNTKLLPYWQPGSRPRVCGFDAGDQKYWFGDDTHGYVNLEGAELHGFLAGLINDNGKFDPLECNCEIRWDDETSMFWVFSGDQGWKEGTVCELYVFYGVQYWFHNFNLLTKKNRKTFHRKHLREIQKLVDAQSSLVYVDPFTGQPMPKSDTPVPAPAPAKCRVGGPGRKPKRAYYSIRGPAGSFTKIA